MVNGTAPFTAPVQVYSDLDAKNQFGAGSWAHLMTRVAIQNNPLIRLSVIGLKDSDSGVAATGTVTLAGTATLSQGVVKAVIGGVDYAVAVAKGEAADTILPARLACGY